MARILCVDYGVKKCGIAVTDPLQIIVSGLDTVSTSEIYNFLINYTAENEVEKVVFGDPKHKDGTPTYLRTLIDEFVNKLLKKRPFIKVDFEDEAYTSAEAKSIIFQSGVKKKKRKDKSLVDKISAVLILQKHLGHI